MFAAVALFVLLLIGILYIAFMRFRNPPPPTPLPATPAAAAPAVRAAPRADGQWRVAVTAPASRSVRVSLDG